MSQRPDLDVGSDPALVARGLQRAGVLERGDRALTGKAARMAAGQLAGIQRDRGDLAIVDADLDAPADERRVQRVVVTLRDLLADLATQTRNTIRVPDGPATFTKLTQPTPSQARALQVLDTITIQ